MKTLIAIDSFKGCLSSEEAAQAGAVWAVLGGELIPGADAVLDLLGFERRLEGVSLLITGEGRMDRQPSRAVVKSAVKAILSTKSCRSHLKGRRWSWLCQRLTPAGAFRNARQNYSAECQVISRYCGT